MTTLLDKQIEIANYLLKQGLVNRFAHSVEILTEEQSKYPVFRRGAEFVYIGVDDTGSRFGYSRLNGNPSMTDDFSTGSCSKGYTVNAPFRVVIFNDYEKLERSYLISKFLGLGFIHNVTINGYSDNAPALAAEESPIIDLAYDGKIFYLAIDITIKAFVIKDDCEKDSCKEYPNPICLP